MRRKETLVDKIGKFGGQLLATKPRLPKINMSRYPRRTNIKRAATQAAPQLKESPVSEKEVDDLDSLDNNSSMSDDSEGHVSHSSCDSHVNAKA